MKRHWSYLVYLLRHKWFVLLEGRLLHVPLWMLILHDWDKFLPSRWFAYAHAFYTDDGVPQRKPDAAFEKAWKAHQTLNKHHWQWHGVTLPNGEIEYRPIPDVHRREMLADWRGAVRAQGKTDDRGLYLANRDVIQLHPETRAWVEAQLGLASEQSVDNPSIKE